MSRAVALNYFLGGALLGVTLTNACNRSGSPLDAWAQGEAPVQVEIVGTPTISVLSADDDPIAVKICSGQPLSGECVHVAEDGFGDNGLETF